jgi:hypothetical protein
MAHISPRKSINFRKGESRLDVAIRLVEEEIYDLSDSAPRGVLNRMERLSRELQDVEDSL